MTFFALPLPFAGALAAAALADALAGAAVSSVKATYRPATVIAPAMATAGTHTAHALSRGNRMRALSGRKGCWCAGVVLRLSGHGGNALSKLQALTH